LLWGLVVPAALVLTSCTKREDLPLAEFKDKKITVGDFEEAYPAVKPEFLPRATGIEGRREFLTTMLNRAVMAYKSDELGYDKDPGVVQGMETFQKMGLQAGYLKRRVSDQLELTEKEVREHWTNKGTTMTIKQILVDSPAEAEEVVALLDEGNDFESVCKRYSKSPDGAEGGQVLTVTYGRYAPELQQEVFRLKIGGHTPPVWTPYGFFIVKGLSRAEPREREDYDENHERLEQEARAIKEMLATNAHTEKIRESYGVQWYWDSLRICFEALPADRPFEQAPSRRDEVYPLLYFDPEDLAKPVVTYQGKDLLIKDFSDYYDQGSFYSRPRRDFRVAGVKTFLTERIMSDIIMLEMARSNIADDPEVKKVMDSKREEMMVNRLWDDMVNKQTVVTDQMIRDYYASNEDKFQLPERRRFGVILTGDFDSAQKAYQEINSGTLFRTVAMAYSIDEGTRDKLAQTELLSKGEQAEIDAVGFALPGVGSVSEPFETSRGWMILKVTELEEPSKYTLEQARGSVEGALKEQINDNRLNELLAKWKEELGLVIHEDNLAKIQVEERSPGSAPATEHVHKER
jgi:parvulin-like peptidyl-prolyl isomerase